MSSKHPATVLSEMNPGAYVEAVTFLRSVITLIKGMKLEREATGSQYKWEFSCQQVVFLVSKRSYFQWDKNFYLTSRFTQDCLENHFTVVRLKNPISFPLALKYALKVICIAQSLKAHSGFSGRY